VPEPVGLEDVDGLAYRRGASHLAGMRNGAKAAVLGQPEGRPERGAGIGVLRAPEAESHHSALAVLHRVARRHDRDLRAEIPRDVRRQPYVDAGFLLRLDRAVTKSGEDLVPRGAAADSLARREDPLQVHRAVGRRLRRVVDHDLAEVPLLLQGTGRHQPQLKEVLEIPELIEPGEFCLG